MTTVTDFVDGEDVDAFLINSRIQALLRAMLNPTAVPQDQTTAATVTTTSATYVALTGGPTVNFVAPPSGIVRVTCIAAILNSNTVLHTYAAFALTGAGTYAANDNDAAHVFGPNECTSCAVTLVRGLTSGGAYTATMQYRSQTTAGTGTFYGRRLLVEPVWPLA